MLPKLSLHIWDFVAPLGLGRLWAPPPPQDINQWWGFHFDTKLLRTRFWEKFETSWSWSCLVEVEVVVEVEVGVEVEVDFETTFSVRVGGWLEKTGLRLSHLQSWGWSWSWRWAWQKWQNIMQICFLMKFDNMPLHSVVTMTHFIWIINLQRLIMMNIKFKW